MYGSIFVFSEKKKKSMSYLVFARKYRPQTFDEVVGQDHVCHTLKNAIREERVAHAYIFIGPKGTGKTSVARILAKALNCEKGPTPEPCCTCDICRDIAAGSDMDVAEIDGASNRGIENIKELRENAKFAPGRSRYKIYIIDEVHMLSPDANNALLKTLEEPPAHIKFVFATTEPHKVISTVFSRCQRFDFRLIPLEKIVERLEQITAAENITCERKVLTEIARAAGGGMRDAQSILDQVVSYGIEGIEPEDIRRIIGSLDPDVIRELAESVLTGDTSAALGRMNDIIDSGTNIRELVSEMITFIRNTIVLDECGEDTDLMPVPDREHIASMERILESNSVEKLLLASKMLEDFLVKSRYMTCRKVLLEITVINIMKSGNFMSIEELLARAGSLSGDSGSSIATPEQSVSEEKVKRVGEKSRAAPPDRATVKEESSEITGEFLSDLAKEDRVLGAFLSAERISGAYSDDILTLDVEEGRHLDENEKEMFEMHEEWDTLIRDKAAAVFGNDVTVAYRFLQPSPDSGEELAEEALHSYDEESDEGQEKEDSPFEKSEHIRRYEPIVDKIIDMFKGKVLNVQEK